MADGHHTPASTVAKLHYLVRDPTRTVYMVLALADQSLLSSGKFAKPGYIYICDGKEFNIYDGRTVRIEVSEAVVLKLWHWPNTKLFWVSLQVRVTHLNMHTVLINGPTDT